MVRLTGKKLPIGLFGGMQGIAARDRSCRFNARPAGESGFIHERDYLIGCARRGLNGSAVNNKRPEAGIFAAGPGDRDRWSQEIMSISRRTASRKAP